MGKCDDGAIPQTDTYGPVLTLSQLLQTGQSSLTRQEPPFGPTRSALLPLYVTTKAMPFAKMAMVNR
jgi:hypothetical protein